MLPVLNRILCTVFSIKTYVCLRIENKWRILPEPASMFALVPKTWESCPAGKIAWTELRQLRGAAHLSHQAFREWRSCALMSREILQGAVGMRYDSGGGRDLTTEDMNGQCSLFRLALR